MTKLPEKLSDLIELALRDLRKVENDKRYRVNMYAWHEPSDFHEDCECRVCFAGAVMARTLEAPINKDVSPSFFDAHTAGRLNALNEVRIGSIRRALEEMGKITDNEFERFDPPQYRTDPEGFHAEISALAVRLREAGY